MRALFLALLLSGCGTTIYELDVHPKVQLKTSDQKLALVVDVVPNRMELHHTSLMRDVKLSALRIDLQKAFDHAFSPSHPIVRDPKQADFTLVFTRCRPALQTSDCANSGVCSYDMVLYYDAYLQDHDGKHVATMSHSITAHGGGWDGVALSSLIAQMYEEIAKELE